MALRYFYEDMPALHVIGAGSLLEFALEAERMSMPVGRVQPLFMHPVEVKAGKAGRLRSLGVFAERYRPPLTVRVYGDRLRRDGDLISGPALRSGAPAALPGRYDRSGDQLQGAVVPVSGVGGRLTGWHTGRPAPEP